jgi:hypothetical protein
MVNRKYGWLVLSGLLFITLALVACASGAATPMPQAAPAFDFAEDEGYYGNEAFAGEEKAIPVEEAEMAPEEPSGVSRTAATGVDISVQQVTIERLIIRNGHITIQAEDTRVAEEAVEKMVAEMAPAGAFIVSRDIYGGDPGSPYISMSIRVPVERFEETMDRLSALAAEGTTPSRNESGQDVTEEYVDLQARLESLEAARQRLMQIMQEAQTTEELLLAEQQLTQREAEIESIKGRMQYLSQSANLSSIYVELQPYILSQPVDTRWRPAEVARQAIDALINGARGFANFLIVFVIAVLPWLILFGLVIYGIVRFVMWRVRVGREKRAARASGQD